MVQFIQIKRHATANGCPDGRNGPSLRVTPHAAYFNADAVREFGLGDWHRVAVLFSPETGELLFSKSKDSSGFRMSKSGPGLTFSSRGLTRAVNSGSSVRKKKFIPLRWARDEFTAGDNMIYGQIEDFTPQERWRPTGMDLLPRAHDAAEMKIIDTVI